MKRRILPTLASLLALTLAACGASQDSGISSGSSMNADSMTQQSAVAPGREEISGADAQQMVEEGATLVDVRVPEEFAAEHIPGAANIPLAVISREKLNEQNIQGAVILYCNSGNQSSQALDKLRSEGYDTVFSMGSIDAWPGETTTTDDSSRVTGDLLAQMDDDDTSPIDEDEVDPFESDEESPVGIDDDNNSLDNNGDDDSINVEDDDNDSLGGPDDI